MHSFLAAILDEGFQVGKICEFLFIDGRLGSNRQRRAHLGDHDADLSRGNLHPRIFLDGVYEPGFPAKARHQEFRLVASLAIEGDRVVLGKFFPGEPLGYKTDFGGADAVSGVRDTKDEKKPDDEQEESPKQGWHGQASIRLIAMKVLQR